MKAIIPVLLALSATSAALAGNAGARWQQNDASAAGRRPGIARTFADEISLGQAIQMVEARFNARVVRSTVQESNGRRIYVLRVVSDREVRVVRVDAASGSIL